MGRGRQGAKVRPVARLARTLQLIGMGVTQAMSVNPFLDVSLVRRAGRMVCR